MCRPSLEQPTNGLLSDSASAEEARIRNAYAKRQKDDARYSWFNPGNLLMIQDRERQLLALLCRYGLAPLTSKKILEIGCGTGYWLREFIKWGAKPENVTGIDLLQDRFTEARYLCPVTVNLHCGNANDLEFEDSTFDLVLQSTVFTSILDQTLKQQVAGEMVRVLKKNGIIVWYDYHVSNPWNPDVKGIKKKELYELFPGCQLKLRRITLAPPLARWIAPRSWLLAYLMESIPLLRTHYIGVIRKA